MTAYITIPVATAKNVLRVPNGALRYKPDMKAEDIRALYKKYGLQGSEQTRAGTEGPGAGGASGKQWRSQSQDSRGGGGNTGSGGDTGHGDAAQTRVPRLDVAVVWKLRSDKTLEPVRIRTGITDHTVTEVTQVLNGDLKDGDQLVTGAMTATSGSRPPGMGGAQPGRMR